jgi:hypothetical protein
MRVPDGIRHMFRFQQWIYSYPHCAVAAIYNWNKKKASTFISQCRHKNQVTTIVKFPSLTLCLSQPSTPVQEAIASSSWWAASTLASSLYHFANKDGKASLARYGARIWCMHLHILAKYVPGPVIAPDRQQHCKFNYCNRKSKNFAHFLLKKWSFTVL